MKASETIKLEFESNEERTAPGLALPPRVPGLILRLTGLVGLPLSLIAALFALYLLLDASETSIGPLIALVGLQVAGVGTALLRLRAARWIAADINLERAALACRISLVQEAARLIGAALISAAIGSTTLVGGAILPAGAVICLAYAWSYGKIMARARSLAGA